MLTGKQQKFTELVLSGENYTQAYRQAYDVSGMKPATIQEEAWRLSQHPEVSLRIREAREAVSLTAEELAAEAIENMHEARYLGQIAAANGAVQLAARLSGNLEGPPAQAQVRITKVTVVLTSAGESPSQSPIVDVSEYEVYSDSEKDIEGPK